MRRESRYARGSRRIGPLLSWGLIRPIRGHSFRRELLTDSEER